MNVQKWLRQCIDIVKVLLFGLLIVIPIHYFVIQPYRVPDNRFAPVFLKDEVILINRLPLVLDHYGRGDIVVYRDINNQQIKEIGKIIGLPYERVHINDGIASITTQDDEKIVQELPIFGEVYKSLPDVGKLDAHEYFIVSEALIDKSPGIVDIRHIIGKPIFRVFPITRITKLY